MNSYFFTALLFVACASLTFAQPTDKKWKLKFEDNFDGPSLDTTKWTFGFGWGLNSGAFDETNRKQNLTLKDGMIVFKGEESNGKYYSAAINTRNKMIMKYGYWEIRAQVSKNVSGCDAGFWQKLNNDTWPPELDIFEFMGTDRRQSMNIHWKDNGHKEDQTFFDGGDLTSGFHAFGLETSKNYIHFYTDGKLTREITRNKYPQFFAVWETDPAYTIMNIHLSNRYKVFGQVDPSSLPVFMHVDYFRMYEEINAK